MYSSSNNLDNRTLESLQEQLSSIAPVFPPMPRATAIAEATEHGKPLALSPNKHSVTLKLFDELAIAMEQLPTL
jgi:chromosome partitioning protein